IFAHTPRRWPPTAERRFQTFAPSLRIKRLDTEAAIPRLRRRTDPGEPLRWRAPRQPTPRPTPATDRWTAHGSSLAETVATNAKTIDCWKACSYSTRAMSVKSPTRLGDIGLYRKARKILKEVPVAPDRWTYSDLALPGNDENDRLDIYHATAGGERGACPRTPRRHAASGPGQNSFRRGRGLSICRSDPPAISLDSSRQNRRPEESNNLEASGGEEIDDLLNGVVGAVVGGFEFARWLVSG